MSEQEINVKLGLDQINVVVGGKTINVINTNAVTNNFVASDVRFSLNGAGGNSYLIFNSSTGNIELYVLGSKKAQWGAGGGSPF